MKALLIEETIVITSSAPGKQFLSSVVCFEDCFYIIPKVIAKTFHVNNFPIPSYNFGDDVAKGVRDIMDSCNSEDELKEKLLALLQNNTTLIVPFSDYKKVKIKGFLGVKTLKAMNSAMNYISFTTTKDTAKALVEFYPNL